MSLILPFRPYTPQEVTAITGVSPTTLDKWMGTILPVHTGEDGFTRGLDNMQTFAVYCGRRYTEEGAGVDYVRALVRYVGALKLEHVQSNILKGNTFPFVGQPPMLVKQPRSALGQRLNLGQLLTEYIANVQRVFPS